MASSIQLPLEQLLTTGGDTRLVIDGTSGRNRYGCLPRPDCALPLGSCTSSTISQLGYEAARDTHRHLVTAADVQLAANQCAADIRQRLQQLLNLPDGVDVALGPSGTDVELLALALAAGAADRRIMNIVVGPTEVGSGTMLAAACRHYDSMTPGGQRVVAGECVDEKLASLVDVRSVDLRTANGEMLSESEIDAAVIELVLEASERDMVVLLHIVAHSKTGVHAPSLSCVERITKASDDVVVVVDAAQGRFSRRGLRDVLRKNYLVIFTGSKFYGGPPFSGALLVPPKLHPAKRKLGKLPAGFRDYFSAAEMPESWSEIRKSLAADSNIGGLLRWSAALSEMDGYYRVPSDARLRVLRFFEAEVPRVFAASSMIRLLPVFSPLYDDTCKRLLQSKTTVFGFWVTSPGSRRPMGKSELQKLQADLASDVASTFPDIDRQIASQTFQIGQPVDLGVAGYVLRVALGGALITRVSTDKSFGESFDDRLNWLGDQLTSLRRKVECLAGHSQRSEESNMRRSELSAATMAR